MIIPKKYLFLEINLLLTSKYSFRAKNSLYFKIEILLVLNQKAD